MHRGALGHCKSVHASRGIELRLDSVMAAPAVLHVLTLGTWLCGWHRPASVGTAWEKIGCNVAPCGYVRQSPFSRYGKPVISHDLSQPKYRA